MPTTIEATYHVVTPMFCGGVDSEISAELRPASFKGVLRFWWRALAWSRLKGDLEKIKRQEDELFGSAAGGQSRVSMRLIGSVAHAVKTRGEVLTLNKKVVDVGARYLGYGVMEAFNSQRKGTSAGQLTRACLLPPFRFTIKARVREGGWDEAAYTGALATLEDALICLGTLGGMGAKSRKGYGSLVLQSLYVGGEPRWSPPTGMVELRDSLARFRCETVYGRLPEYPEYTAFSPKARHVLMSSDKDRAIDLLDLIGKELLLYRSWGRNGKVLGRVAEKNFKDDHDLMKRRRRNEHPRRIAFGLPHNYGKWPSDQVRPKNGKFDRRASPLFIHIHECGKTPVVVLSFLPARFLPKNASDIAVGEDVVPQMCEADLFRPIEDFLERLMDPDKRQRSFQLAERALP